MSSPGSADALRRSRDEPEAFVDFYRLYYASIVAYLARRIYDPDAALELTAETFAAAYIARRRFRGTTAAEAESWLYRIAQRKLARYLRRGKLERRAIQRLQIEVPAINAEQRARVEELADLEGIRSALRSELTRLSTAQKEVLRLRVIEDLPYADVAARLDISEQAARARVSRALKTLASALEPHPLVKEMQP